MFKLDKFTSQNVGELTDFDMIPYKLTGVDTLHAQGFVGQKTKVAVIDTGCDWNHTMLKDNIVIKTENLCGSLGGSMDDDGHGTCVASTIVTLAPQCEIIPIKVLMPYYGGENAWVIAGVRRAVELGADVINMSLSSNMKIGSSDHIAFENAIDYANENNIFVVVASGNTGKETTLFPACFDKVTTVGAVDVNKHEALFSTLSDKVDVCQVGVDLVGAKLNGGYVKMSGTSMATPMVTGMTTCLVGKYKEQHDGRRPTGTFVNNMLRLLAMDIGVKGIDNKSGAGFISFNPNAKILDFETGTDFFTSNGEKVQMDVITQRINNRNMLPVRYANHGKLVCWDKNEPNEFTIVG